MYTTFLKGTDVARILNISKALAYKLIADGQIASVRFGRTVRVSQEALNSFLQRMSVGDNAKASTSGVVHSQHDTQSSIAS